MESCYITCATARPGPFWSVMAGNENWGTFPGNGRGVCHYKGETEHGNGRHVLTRYREFLCPDRWILRFPWAGLREKWKVDGEVQQHYRQQVGCVAMRILFGPVGLSFHVSLISFFSFSGVGMCPLDDDVWAWQGSARRWNVGGTANILFNRNKWTRVHMVSFYVCPFSGESDLQCGVGGGGETGQTVEWTWAKGQPEEQNFVRREIDGIRTVICSVKMQI